MVSLQPAVFAFSPSSKLFVTLVCPLLNHINGKLMLGLTPGLRRITVAFVGKQMDRKPWIALLKVKVT